MIPPFKKIPRKYHPKGFEILFEDNHIIIGNKSPGYLTVAALWNKEKTIHAGLNEYVKKGNSASKKKAYVVHRLDQGTSGVMIYAKSEHVQMTLKDNWKSTVKIYYAVVHGRVLKKSGIIESYLVEDDEYVMHSTKDASKGKLAQTQYEVLKETNKYTLLKINLLTGRKNQIRVHFADLGHPIVGDEKYKKETTRFKRLALHSYSLSLPHPITRDVITVTAPIPEYFETLVGSWEKTS